jgi:energy-coupling factor transport system ATP-binding protein
VADIEYSGWGYAYPSASRPALSNVTLSLDPSQFTLVIGESGAGKSTLARAVNGLVPHFAGGRILGRLRVAGLDPVEMGPSRMAQHVGMVFQDPESQFVLDTVEDEVAFALENAAVPRDEMRRRVAETLIGLGIGDLRQRALHTLSGGEQQRVAIASALVLRPSVLVLDEPTSQLDPATAAEVLDLLTDLNKAGLSIVLVEHRLERVLPYVGKIVSVTNGTAVAGSPQSVLATSAIAPPIVELGRALGLDPLPLTPADAAHMLAARVRATPPTAGRRDPRTPGAEVLRLCGVQAGYGDDLVLRDVDLALCQGEIVALIGRNGQGKSTLLRTIVGLVKPVAGDVRVGGESVIGWDTATISRRVAYLPQNPNALLYADTVADELNITRRNHGLHALDAGEVEKWLGRLRLAGLAGAFPRDLSVGERERVAIGAVTVTRPVLLLLDEPTRGLDYAAKRALADLLLEWRNDGCAALVVSHDVEFIAGMADRVVALDKGRIVADGPPAEVLAGDPVFTPQIAQAFPGAGWITVADALAGLRVSSLSHHEETKDTKTNGVGFTP